MTTSATDTTDTTTGRRCFGDGDRLYETYHDEEWGVPPVPSEDERELLERLSLEAFQSGLSWITVLRKRESFRRAFADFAPAVVAEFDDEDVARLLADPGIVRNRAKVLAAIGNARALLALHAQGRRLTDVLEAYREAPGTPRRATIAEVPASTPGSAALAKELKGLGFRFLGPTTVYATMQALGLVDDHLVGCPVVTARS